MARPHVYVLGGTPEIYVTTIDLEGVAFIPSEIRLSVKEPDGDIITWSGADLTAASGYLYTLYRPLTVGWYQTETWVKDGTGREDTDTNGFEVIDSVHAD